MVLLFGQVLLSPCNPGPLYEPCSTSASAQVAIHPGHEAHPLHLPCASPCTQGQACAAKPWQWPTALHSAALNAKSYRASTYPHPQACI